MTGPIDNGATGDIALALMRRQGMITSPLYLWTGTAWVDFAALTAAQFSSWVDIRCAGAFVDYTTKTANITISRTNDW